MLVLTEVGVRRVLRVVGANIFDWLGIIEVLFVIFSCNETGRYDANHVQAQGVLGHCTWGHLTCGLSYHNSSIHVSRLAGSLE